LPPVKVDDSLVDVNGTQNVEKSSQEGRSHESVVLHRVEASYELIRGMDADIIALPSRVAEGLTSQIDVAVCVCPHQVEEKATTALLFTAYSQLVATGSWMTGEKLNNKSRNLEKAIEEGASNNASPMPCDKSGEGSRALGLVCVPVPVGGTASYTEVN